MRVLRFFAVGLVCCLVFAAPKSTVAQGKDPAIELNQKRAVPEIQPLYSRYAQTVSTWTLRGGANFFTDADLQEAKNFDGAALDLELTVPLNDRFQVRLYYPFYTDGEARSTNYGQVELDIEGDGGLLDFPSLTVDYQFLKADSVSAYNLAAYLGVGTVFDELEARGQHSAYFDIYNHRGSVLLFGLKADREFARAWSFIANLGGRYYWDSDDLHPKDEGSDKFWLLDASAALAYTPADWWLFPVLEMVFRGDLDNCNCLFLVPQMIIRCGCHLDFNAGVGIGLTNDGPSTETRLQMTLRY
ncbi:MAG: hypothetical protein JXR89_11545 [Deltaproteobacteria bacterium]|nr:hypothetical protein [Deltaproteobacteria bacterium]